MAITIEDGTGVEDAEAYEAVSVVSAWLVLRGMNAYSALTTGQKESHLRLATSYAENYLRANIGGIPTDDEQGLLFPRQGCYRNDGRILDLDEIPKELKEGIRLLAEDSANGKLGVTAATGLRSGIVSVSEDGDSVTFGEGGSRPSIHTINAAAAAKLDMLWRTRGPWES